jgi:hypothetical protein
VSQLDLRERVGEVTPAGRVAERLTGTEYSEAELEAAAAAVLARNEPPRDSIVLREAARRRAARSPEAVEAWARARETLADAVAESTFCLWFAPLELVGAQGDALVLSGPRHVCRWVSRRYAMVVLEAVRRSSEFATVQLEGAE